MSFEVASHENWLGFPLGGEICESVPGRGVGEKRQAGARSVENHTHTLQQLSHLSKTKISQVLTNILVVNKFYLYNR